MVVGKNNITAMFEEWQLPYFAIFYKGKIETGNAIVRNDKDEKDYDFITGKHRFEKTLDLLSYGEYTIVVSKEKDVTKRGGTRVDFKIPVNEASQNPGVAVQQMAGIGAISMEDVERRANEIAENKFTQLMDRRELADTKEKLKETERELREAEKKVGDPFNKFIGALAPHSESIVAGLMGRPAQIATTVVSGINADAVAENDTDAQKIMEDFIDALAASKPNTWKQILQQFTILIKDNPSKFDTALTFL